VFVRTQTTGNRTYLLIVENERVEGRVKQRILHRLGRLDELLSTGQLDSLLASLGRFSEKYTVLGAHRDGETVTTRTRRIGPGLIFERLWRETGIHAVFEQALRGRRFEFPVERAVFLTVLHRLFASGSDRAADRWREDYAIPGSEDVTLRQLYRAMACLGEPLEPVAADASPFDVRTMKDRIEEALFAQRRDLFTTLDMVFFDTTSIYFEGEGGESIGQYGHSKDHRPDLKQMVVGMVLDNDGNPICSGLWPGNTTDVKSLAPIVQRLQTQFCVRDICIVADRGMISKQAIDEVKARGWHYILGVRMRRGNEARDIVLARPGRYEEVYPKSDNSKDPSPLAVKEVWYQDRRYVVCRNEDQATKDRHDREAIVESLNAALKRGDKALVGNNGYRRYLKTEGPGFSIDRDKIKEEERFDGKWVLITNTDLSARDVAIKYKQLWTVEAIFRTMKTQLATRPIFHKSDDAIRGHVFCSFLALVLRKALEDRLQTKGYRLEWDHILNDLDGLQEVEISLDGKAYTLRTETKGTIGKVFQACGVSLPPTLRMP
jgi:Transposase DDE domain